MTETLITSFDYAYRFLEAAFGPLGPLYAIGVFGLFLILMALPIALKKPEDPLDRFSTGETRPQATSDRPDANPVENVKLRHESNSTLEAFAQYLEPQDQQEFSASRLKLTQAGYRSRSAVSTYNFLRVAIGLGMLGFGLMALLVSGGSDDIAQSILTVLVPGIIGYFGPSYWVTRRVQQRQEEISSGFPDALDLMLVCVEAGQSLDQSILRVSEEIKPGYPTLAEEFEIVANEIRAGKDRVTVLRDMAERCGVPDVSSFVTVLIQSASFGTSIASALRVYAGEMRDKRVMRAEEKANVLPTKLTVGTMLFTVPPLLIILVGPSILEIMQTLGGGI
ncbi:MAG: type II secretion system F family protein [Pseudomonadota bacterium]